MRTDHGVRRKPSRFDAVAYEGGGNMGGAMVSKYEPPDEPGDADDVATTAGLAGEYAMQRNTNEKRILVVENQLDHSGTSHTVMYLMMNGFQVALATDGADALAWLTEETFDAVVSDVIVPGLSGLELLERIRQRSPSMQVVLVSDFMTNELRPLALEAGATALLEKPVNGDTLAAILNHKS